MRIFASIKKAMSATHILTLVNTWYIMCEVDTFDFSQNSTQSFRYVQLDDIFPQSQPEFQQTEYDLKKQSNRKYERGKAKSIYDWNEEDQNNLSFESVVTTEEEREAKKIFNWDDDSSIVESARNAPNPFEA